MLKPKFGLKKPKKAASNIVAIIDCSGSMAGYEKMVTDSFNELVQVVKSNKESTLSLFSFNQDVKEHYFKAKAEEVVEVSASEYQAAGMTALYDAMGQAINKLRAEDEDFLVYIITDGYENSSREYNSDQIKTLVKKLEKTRKWRFVYVGCDHDVYKAGMGAGINNNIMFSKTSSGYSGMSRGLTAATLNYLAADDKVSYSDKALVDDIQSNINS